MTPYGSLSLIYGGKRFDIRLFLPTSSEKTSSFLCKCFVSYSSLRIVSVAVQIVKIIKIRWNPPLSCTLRHCSFWSFFCFFYSFGAFNASYCFQDIKYVIEIIINVFFLGLSSEKSTPESRARALAGLARKVNSPFIIVRFFLFFFQTVCSSITERVLSLSLIFSGAYTCSRLCFLSDIKLLLYFIPYVVFRRLYFLIFLLLFSRRLGRNVFK